MMVRGELIEPFHSNYGYTMYEHQLDFWTPTNTDARWPRLTDISDPRTRTTTAWVRTSTCLTAATCA